jgi:hypothetical protein
MSWFSCPYLHGKIELSKEREKHIAEHHPDLLPGNRKFIITALLDPDEVRRSSRFTNALLFSRWFPDFRGGKYVVVVVVNDSGVVPRNWIITAYIARKLVGGVVEWKRS